MNTTTLEHLVRTSQADWAPLVEAGVDTAGIFVKALRRDAVTGRALTFLLRFEPGSSYPYHNHPGGEEIYVLSGTCVIEGTTVSEGDYLYTPPGYRHSVRTEVGCTLFFQVPVEVEIL